jgi:hypothetical protein
MAKKKTSPKMPTEWELQQRKEKKRARLALAVAAVIGDRDTVWRFRRDDDLVCALEELAEQLPALRLIEALEQIDAKEAEEHAAFEAGLKKPRAKKATAKRATPRRATAKRATPVVKAAKVAKRAKAVPSTKADLDNALPGYLEDEALNLASKKGSVTAGDLLKALPEATRGQATGALSRLVTRGRLSMTGRARGAKYVLPNGAGTQIAIDEASAT